MITESTYENLKERYGSISSWAVWRDVGSTPKSNMRDLSMFEDSKILTVLNSSFVFVGLNGSGVHDEFMDSSKPWHNFHSSNPRGHDYKLRYATIGTPFWGAYITDIIKNLQEVDSTKVLQYIQEHPSVLQEHIDNFRMELSLFPEKPTLIALGSAVFDILSTHLHSEYTIKKIHHYSFTGISKELYREELLGLLEIKSTPEKTTPKEISSKKNVSREISADNYSELTDSATCVYMSDVFQAQMKKFESNYAENWKTDTQKNLISFFEPILYSSAYRLEPNLTDTTKKGVNLFVQDESKRVMGFEKKKHNLLFIYPTTQFYETFKHKIKLREPNEKKSQPHIDVSLKELWNILCIVTGNTV